MGILSEWGQDQWDLKVDYDSHFLGLGEHKQLNIQIGGCEHRNNVVNNM